MKISIIYIIWGLFFCSALSFSAEQGSPPLISEKKITTSNIKELAFSKEWLKLLHYKKNLFGNYKSQVDGIKFFLSPQGKNDPLAELYATLNFFFNDEKAFCRFPARYQIIQKYLGLNTSHSTCPDFTQFLVKTKLESISVAFSSYYMDSPASIFGHTFVKLESGKADLLEYGVNFSVDIGDSGSLKYIFGGLTGYFDGKYAVIPYHDKVREYNDFENRDIWLYYLNLSEQELDLFIKHLWELMQTSYDYFFLTENCSYHVLSAIEAAVPRFDLTDQTKSVVIPVETLKILTQYPGLLKDFKHIPSLRNVFFKQYSFLGEQERDKFHRFLENKNLEDINNDSISARTLDAIIDYYNFQYPTFRLHQDNMEEMKIFNLKKKLNIIRAQKNNDNEKNNSVFFNDYKIAYPPHYIHDSRRITIFSGKDSSENQYYFQPELRMAFHDLNDSIKGYPVNAEVEMLKASSKVYVADDLKIKSFFLNELTLIKYTSFSDFSFYQHDISWGFYMGAQRYVDKRCENKNGFFAPELSFSIGLSKIMAGEFFLEAHPSFLAFALVKTDFIYSNSFTDSPSSFGIGPLLGFKWTISDSLNFLCSFEYLKLFNYDDVYLLKLVTRYQILQNLSLDLSYLKSLTFEDYKLGLMFFF